MEESPKKPRGRPFQKGHKFSKGQHQITSDERQAREMNVLEFMRIANKYLYCSVEELLAVSKDTSIPVVEAIVVRVLLIAGQNGDERKLEFVLNRVLGKVADKIDHSNKDGTMSGAARVVITLPENGKAKKP